MRQRVDAMQCRAIYAEGWQRNFKKNKRIKKFYCNVTNISFNSPYYV